MAGVTQTESSCQVLAFVCLPPLLSAGIELAITCAVMARKLQPQCGTSRMAEHPACGSRLGGAAVIM